MPEHRKPLFVYGTLRPGQRGHARLLAGRTLWECPAVLHGHQLLDGGLPLAAPAEGDRRVVGELVGIAPAHYDEVLFALDRLQLGDAGSPYVRAERPVHYHDASGREVTTTAWVYLASPDALERLAGTLRAVPHGDWSRVAAPDPEGAASA